MTLVLIPRIGMDTSQLTRWMESGLHAINARVNALSWTIHVPFKKTHRIFHLFGLEGNQVNQLGIGLKLSLDASAKRRNYNNHFHLSKIFNLF